MAVCRSMLLVVMGVSGSGKTTIAQALARRLGLVFQDADDFHSAANIARMKAGIALTEADRAPWLATIAAWAKKQAESGQGGVLACSLLRRLYREQVLTGVPDPHLIYLRVKADILRARLEHRSGHFMPASLLDNQLATLEEPADTEHALTVDAGQSPDAVVAEIIRRL
ncbi:gluconokinase [Granulibacter bethesdensis]|uniref:gluconokinase n=1 Tax=Granulibacter bethesdensis TaxID=364410 RepID=UPI00090C7562|nr:gluconokinase [Granulibacter bethesdensis]APH59187.1 Gluconokinase [Granulibacter bethesdensis]